MAAGLADGQVSLPPRRSVAQSGSVKEHFQVWLQCLGTWRNISRMASTQMIKADVGRGNSRSHLRLACPGQFSVCRSANTPVPQTLQPQIFILLHSPALTQRNLRAELLKPGG